MALPPVLAKLAITAAKNPKGTKKVLKGILIAIVVIIMIPAAMLQSISALFGESEPLNERFDIGNSDLYKAVNSVYLEHINQITAKMDQKAQEILDNHRIHGDPELGTEDTYSVDVYIHVNHASLSGLLTYLTLRDPSVLSGKKYSLDEAVIFEYYDSISSIDLYTEGKSYQIENQYWTPEIIASYFFKDDKTTQNQFLVSYSNYKEFLRDIEEAGETIHQGGTGEEYTGEIAFAPNGMEIPLYIQGGNSPWAGISYGGGNIATSGCGPTSIAMVFSYLLDETIIPSDIVEWTGNRFYKENVGSSWSIFSSCANQWNLKCNNLGMSSESMIQALENGYPVIASVKKGTFTSSGHFIVLRGITESGKILVNDPNDNVNKNHMNKEFSLDLILRESKNFWSFKK